MISFPRSLIAIEAWGSSCTTVVIASLVAVNGYLHGDRRVGLNESVNVTNLVAHSGKESCACESGYHCDSQNRHGQHTCDSSHSVINS